MQLDMKRSVKMKISLPGVQAFRSAPEAQDSLSH